MEIKSYANTQTKEEEENKALVLKAFDAGDASVAARGTGQ
jgi:hypothetical protein